MYMPPSSTVPPAAPSAVDHLTALSAVPATVALNRTDPPGSSVAAGGSIDTVTASFAATEMAADAVFDGSAWLVATTWNVPATRAAVYVPSTVISPASDPSCRDQTTELSLAPVTVAANRCVPAGGTTADGGVIEIATAGASER
jgi:hypothetical protein